MSDLFQSAELSTDAPRPLADRLRPTSLDDIVGQDHLLGEGAPLRRMIRSGVLSSLILWGPPGVGKTTLARLLAQSTDLEFVQISAIFSGVADLRKVFQQAEAHRESGRGTLLFVDEIHRFNKSQQDSFLPYVERGVITLIGATTENPSFELNAALLSRARVFVLNRLDENAINEILRRAEDEVAKALPITDDARKALVAMADGDGRYAINLAESIFAASLDGEILHRDSVSTIVQRRMPLYDKGDDGHYDLASALQKSIRGSDVDAALYWTARMVVGGEDPKFIFRRLIVIASEDIGNADPQALPLAMAARDAFVSLGQPEGEIALGQLVAYLATAPKSNRSHIAFKEAKALASESGSLPPPPHAVNAPTELMKSIGNSDSYVYDHDLDNGFAGLNYFPVDLPRQTFYRPTSFGFDKEIKKRLDYWTSLRRDS